MKYLGYNVTKSWDGKDKNTLSSESARLWVGKLIIDLRWKSAETGKDPYYALGLMIKKKLGEITEIMHISYSPIEKEFYSSFNFLRRIRNIVLRGLHFIEIKETKRKILSLEKAAAEIWQDPMCGCPEDFAEEWSRKAAKLEYNLYHKFYR